MWQLNRLTLKGKYIVFFLVIIFSFFVNSKSTFSQKYEYIGKDSIEIIHSMMAYRLYFLKQNLTFEEVTFKKYDLSSFKKLYDSLSKLYVPFPYTNVSADIKESDGMHGIEVFFYFLMDTNIVYNLWVYIPDKIYKYDELKSSNILKKLYKLQKFGIIAFKDTTNIKSYDNKEPKQKFSKEYRKMLKKLHKKKMKIENGK